MSRLDPLAPSSPAARMPDLLPRTRRRRRPMGEQPEIVEVNYQPDRPVQEPDLPPEAVDVSDIEEAAE